MHHTGHILSAVASLFICTTAFADGGMTGGGGGLVLDRNNPWFMQNTKDVKYCVEVSTDQFSATGDLVQKSIDGAIRYWNEEYASAVIPVFDTRIEPVRIAAQEFKKVGCGDSPDLVLQFGVMHPGQEKDIPHSEEFAGATIRTKYDPVNMKGAGYIYISPDRGPWRFKGAPLASLAVTIGSLFLWGVGRLGYSKTRLPEFLDQRLEQSEWFKNMMNDRSTSGFQWTALHGLLATLPYPFVSFLIGAKIPHLNSQSFIAGIFAGSILQVAGYSLAGASIGCAVINHAVGVGFEQYRTLMVVSCLILVLLARLQNSISKTQINGVHKL